MIEPDNIFSGALPVITSIGRSAFDAVWADNEHVDSRSELLHVLHGRVEVRTPEYSLAGARGSTIYTPAGTPHRDIFPPGSAFEVYLIQFAWPDEHRILEKFSPVQLSSLQGAARRRVAAEVHRLYQDFIGDMPFSREINNARLLGIIYSLCQEAAGSPQERAGADSRRQQIMADARRFIDREYGRVVTLDAIASALNISTYYLSHVFSQESGFTLSQYLTDVRMQHAARLLFETRMSVANVGRSVGFEDACYFRKVFKSHYRVSPRDYRSRAVLETI